MKTKYAIVVLALAFSGLSCNERPAAPELKSEPVSSEVRTEASAGAKTVDPATAGTLSGKAVFEGVAPAPAKLSVSGNPECAVMHAGGQIDSEELLVNNGALRNVFVYVKEGLSGYTFAAQSAPVVVENKGCVYAPHVTGAQVGQPVHLVNADATLHNVHSFSINNKAWNVGLPFQAMKVVKKFDTEEIMVKLKCDVHPWMLGYIGVVAHPYFAVTDSEGRFTIKDLPPGEYVIEAWHEKLGVRSQTVKIEPQGTQNIEFKYV